MAAICGFPVRFAQTELCGESDITTGSQLSVDWPSVARDIQNTKQMKPNRGGCDGKQENQNQNIYKKK